jgi:Mg-chelatase subunit ChlD
MAKKTDYEILGVPRTASMDEIRRAYRNLARQYHPDVFPGGEAIFRRIQEAYATLSKRRPLPKIEGENVPDKSQVVDVGITIAPPSFNQLGVLVLDGSSSMEEMTVNNITKAQAVNGAVRDIFTRFKRSRYARNFSFAVVTFDGNAQLHTPIIAAIDVNDDADYDPVKHHGGGTNIGSGLLEARRVAGEFLRKASRDLPTTVVIVVMSDGRDGDGGVGDPAETRRIAEEIKGNPTITICSTYFATSGSQSAQEQEQLKHLASNPSLNYKTVYDAESLRTFFYASLSTNTNITIR